MWESVFEFICVNWLNVLLVIVGASAFIVYWVQERRKISEAASLIVMQVEDLQNRIQEIESFIREGLLDDIAFYESQMSFKTDYWNQYKHYFIKSLDSYSFNTFNDFYDCAYEIFEQQEFIKNLQKNFFFNSQQIIIQMEGNAILQIINTCNNSSVASDDGVKGLIELLPKDMDNKKKEAIENLLLKQIGTSNPNKDNDTFWDLYNKEKHDIISAVNKDAFTKYIPQQARISLESAFKKFNSIPVIGCVGYSKMKKIAERKI